MDKNEIEILAKLKESDKNVYRQVFFLYYQPLLIFAKKFVDEESAKDIVQDCFSNLWQDRSKTEITTSLSAYLFTVIKNRCFKQLKEEKKRSHQQSNLGWKLREDELIFFTHSEKSILEFDVKDRITQVIGQLPNKCKVVFEGSRVEGLSNIEIATKHQISVKAVEKHISKALKVFRAEFQDLLTVLLALLIQKFFQ
jgi:RNA polymerase sigma-70 factor (ECF subfamily)